MTVLGTALILFGPVVNLSCKFLAQNYFISLTPESICIHTDVLNLSSCILLQF